MEKKRPAKHKPTKQIGKALTAQTNQLEIDVNKTDELVKRKAITKNE